MKYIIKPTYTAEKTYETCISKVRNIDLKERLNACSKLIIDAETEFNSKITKGSVHTISKESIINGNVSSKELEKVYTDRMVGSNSPGRNIYDKIFSLPKFGICPLCAHREVETLDHYLPKSDFPRLVVTPTNLVPSCNKCNKSKLTDTPTKPEEETLHPYFDNVSSDYYLFASVNQTTPPSISFYVSPPLNWSVLLQSRIKYHFKAFSLNQLYSTQSAVFLAGIAFRLKQIFETKGSKGVQKYLRSEALSRDIIDKNSWQTALFYCLSNDFWFCNGGFKLI